LGTHVLPQPKEDEMAISAVSEVPTTGYELVRKRKRREKLATMRDYAKADFQPWKDGRKEPGKGLLPPDDKDLECPIIYARLAYGIMLRTKEQLIEAQAAMPIETTDRFMADLVAAAELFKAIVITIETAQLRIISAASAVRNRERS
jgi:hypothetical protein